MGEIGSLDIQETIYNWKALYTISGYLYWLPLILVMGIFKDNRNFKMLYILIPLLIINFFWMFFKQLAGGNSPNSIQLDVTIYSFIIGFGIFWLTVHKFSKYHGIVKFFLYLLIMVSILSIGIFTTFTDFDKTIAIMPIFFILLVGISLFGFVLAVKMCRNQYKPKKFMLWLVVFLPALGIIAMFVYFYMGSVIVNSSIQPRDLIMVFIAGPLIGLFIYVIHLPFFIMGFKVPFYRERFCGYLGLQNNIEDDGID